MRRGYLALGIAVVGFSLVFALLALTGNLNPSLGPRVHNNANDPAQVAARERRLARVAEQERQQEEARNRGRLRVAALEAEADAREGTARRPQPAAGCEVTGEVSPTIRRAICGIATSAHGDPSGFRLTVIATPAVAAAVGVATPDARNALATLAESWRASIGRNLGYVEVFYGQAHLATVRATSTGPARITFH